MSAALVVVDLSYGFTDPASALHCPADDALAATARLLEGARTAGAPVVFTTVAYDAAGLVAARRFLEKGPSLRVLAAGSRWVAIDVRVAPQPGEPVLTKLFASAFFGTSLAPLLVAAGCDEVVLAGASTSGCVRATAVDAVQHGFRVSVVRDAVADRSPSSHEVALSDIQGRYGEVVGVEQAIAGWVRQEADPTSTKQLDVSEERP
jgi:nicotinamidase-related amidase